MAARWGREEKGAFWPGSWVPSSFEWGLLGSLGDAHKCQRIAKPPASPSHAQDNLAPHFVMHAPPLHQLHPSNVPTFSIAACTSHFVLHSFMDRTSFHDAFALCPPSFLAAARRQAQFANIGGCSYAPSSPPLPFSRRHPQHIQTRRNNKL